MSAIRILTPSNMHWSSAMGECASTLDDVFHFEDVFRIIGCDVCLSSALGAVPSVGTFAVTAELRLCACLHGCYGTKWQMFICWYCSTWGQIGGHVCYMFL